MSARARAILDGPIASAYALLPRKMQSEQANVMLLAIGLQESRLAARRQHGNGPARGLWQFERGGGVRGVLTHPNTEHHARALCKAQGVDPIAADVWAALEHDDVLAAGFARLNLWWLPGALPGIGDWTRAWDQYIDAWRPGKPHPDTWGGYYAEAMLTVELAR